jgi:hypothetical protein
VLQLFVVTTSEDPLNPIANPNRVVATKTRGNIDVSFTTEWKVNDKIMGSFGILLACAAFYLISNIVQINYFGKIW